MQGGGVIPRSDFPWQPARFGQTVTKANLEMPLILDYSAHTPTNLPEPTMSTGQQGPILVDIAERIKCPIQAPVHSWLRLFLRASTVSLRLFLPHSWDPTIAAGLSSPITAGRFALEHWSSTGAKNSGLTVRILPRLISTPFHHKGHASPRDSTLLVAVL